tara:strand:+ start:2153 stop:2971 length:819 start_codon:yes stop_codon:yes gene_type:complete
VRIIHIGDVIGKPGRQAVHKYMPQIRSALKPDLIILNGENAAHGFGITAKICEEFYEMGVDCITTGNHVWDQRTIIEQIEDDPRLLRPANFPSKAAGKGTYIGTTKSGQKYLVVNIMGRVFMDPLDDPFRVMQEILQFNQLKNDVDAIFVDIHGEASSEKMAMAHYLDGKVSAVVGTHTHIPTADAQILNNGTAYQTDSGMTGSFDSVVGMEKGPSIQKFVTKMRGEKHVPAQEHVSLCGVFVETDDETGLAIKIEPIRLGGRLSQTPLTAI